MCFRAMGAAFSRFIRWAVVNEKHTIRSQLLWIFGVTCVLTGGITLAICYGALFGVAGSSYNATKQILTDQSYTSVMTKSSEISAAINQQLLSIAQTVAVGGVTYAANLLQPLNRGKLKSQPTYNEFNFVPNCVKGVECPEDFGTLAGRSRFPDIAGFQYGSVQHTSLYLYNSATNQSIRTDSAYQNALSTYPKLNTLIESLPYPDTDMAITFQKGPSTTVFFYLSATMTTAGYNINLNTPNYVAAHRAFPGIIRNSTTYDPSRRSWFKKAPVDGGIYLYGPYRETFTRELIITLSSKVIDSISLSPSTVTLVSSASLLLNDIQQLISQIEYPDEGFGVLLQYSTLNVVVWKDQSYNTYDDINGDFYPISQFDPNLAKLTLKTQNTQSYTDPKGVQWLVSSVPFFQSTSASASGSQSTSSALIMLVFAKASVALHPVEYLKGEIDKTTKAITTQTASICGAMIGFQLIIIVFFVLYITKPLGKMLTNAGKIVKMSAEEEENKDYGPIVENAFLDISRWDEIGALATEYFNVVCLLNNRNVAKKQRRKHPLNPFYYEELQDTTNSPLTWSQLASAMRSYGDLSTPRSKHGGSGDNSYKSANSKGNVGDDDLDVLGSLSTEIPSARMQPFSVATSEEEANKVEITIAEEAPAKQLQHGMVTAVASKQVNWICSIRTVFTMLCLLMLAGILAIMILTAVQLQNQGSGWIAGASNELTNSEVTNLKAVSAAKSAFTEAYFEQLTLESLIGTAFTTKLLSGGLTSGNAYLSNNLRSYTLDSKNPLYDPAWKSPSNDYSGYFLDCKGASSCAAVQNSAQTTLTSLWDIKARTYAYTGSSWSFIQFGLESNGFTRYYPYKAESTYSFPTLCNINDVGNAKCFQKYFDSNICYQSATNPFYTYDPRCRAWYQQGLHTKVPGNVYFQAPRLSSSGKFVLTAYAEMKNTTAANNVLGAINFNIDASTFSNAVNSLKILDNGYTYIIDSTNVTSVVLSPIAPKGCSRVQCAEGFSDSEFAAFLQNVLLPIGRVSGGVSALVANTYQKKGQTWKLAYHNFATGTVNYTIIVTVPLSDILKPSNLISEAINMTVGGMIAAFVIVCLLFVLLFTLLVRELIVTIIDPLNDLRDICKGISDDNLSRAVTTDGSSSKDMTILLEAFSNLVVALRFGSDNYAKGNTRLARAAFTESLALFQRTENLRGIGASENNLASVNMSEQSFFEAERLFLAAIANAESLLVSQTNPAERDKLHRILSDRKGNLALLYLEMNNFSKAFEIIEIALQEDKKSRYIRGCVVKQGILGHYYLKQRELKSAEKLFNSALAFVQRRDGSQLQGDWNAEEASSSEQIALYNLAVLSEARKDDDANVESNYIAALTRVPNMHLQTTTKILLSLLNFFSSRKRVEDAKTLEAIAARHEFVLDVKAASAGGPKRVAFCVDYSGSMSGAKIRAATTNLTTIVLEHIHDSDSFMLIHFTQNVTIDLALCPKSGNVDLMLSKIRDLSSPSGSTAFYDAIQTALTHLKPDSRFSDWVIALTDGEDNGSRIKIGNLAEVLKKSHANVIIIGVGSDVPVADLEMLAKSSPQGMFIAASGDSHGINEAFGKVIAVIQGQVMLEDL